ncbi:Transcriptional regulator KdgR [Pontiella desulfatans]|uniref:Transcriptional regulator KdgR n=1 Tax=Pontiella desulfatans TaxID=2750659 RepID=A0A6C2U1V1_PONDE|nr:IclR family transcriptional regulator [Pontiella desulfatans]VGO13865.1 Transcriptional regulator KdgR [Pontiella desulfatans]
MNERYHVPALKRALEVVEHLAGCGRDGASLSELTDRLGYPKNSIFRITTTLLDMGYISRSAESQRFRLTKKFLSYGLRAVTDENIVEQSVDVMRDLRDATESSVFLGVLHNGGGMVLEQMPGGFPFKLTIDPGARFKLYCSAPGKAILAFLPEEEAAVRMKKIQFKQFTPNTITTRKAFREELDRVRAQGYALDHAEEFDGIHCVGAPIFDYTNHPVAAMWISGASVVIPGEKFGECGPLVKTAALRISERLGYLKE